MALGRCGARERTEEGGEAAATSACATAAVGG